MDPDSTVSRLDGLRPATAVPGPQCPRFFSEEGSLREVREQHTSLGFGEVLGWAMC